MRHIKQYIFTILAFSAPIQAKTLVLENNIFDQVSIEKSIGISAWRKVLRNDVYVKSQVSDYEIKKIKNQKLFFYIAGLHPKDCRFALRKLAHYESYSKHLGFIKNSSYDEKSQRVNFLLSSLLLPYDMSLNFKIPRIKSPGIYPFKFDQGFLSGLHGNIVTINYKNRCLFYTTASWEGPHSDIPNTVFEFFSKALAQLAMENLFRISSTY
ncbi:hypothetical protein A9Q84_11705 [Halobacteriovorax marinus]|uniref:Uncharacterized protein n=1 Tax=Halobacteriovorax marinus TaxID=97084 RepID=A0A1Y5F880_9BACT|nr:hypothetical protein A9Q84_11705 [Halobacteriovorax marinus]